MSEHIKTEEEILDLYDYNTPIQAVEQMKIRKWVSLSWLKEQLEQTKKFPPYTEYTKEKNELMNAVFYEAILFVLSLLEEKP